MSSKTDLVVKLVLVFFISLLSFSIGTFVGKKYSDNQHQLSQLEPSHGSANREVASEHGTEKADGEHGKMSDEEIAKLAEEFVADDKAGEEKTAEHKAGNSHGEVAANEEHGSAKKEEAVKSAREVASEIREEKAPVRKEVAAHTNTAAKEEHGMDKSEREPSSVPKNAGQYAVGKFTVQLAAYADESEAQKMSGELKQKGYSAFYVPANIKGKTWYRVSVGQFATQKEAQTYKTELVEKAKLSSAIVQKITE